MILATTTVEDFDRFAKIFSTKGAEKRGSTGPRARSSSAIPTRTTASGCIFDWDMEGWQSFASDPEVPAIMQEAGHKGRPQVAELSGSLRRVSMTAHGPHQGRRHHRPDGPALVHGHRQRERRHDGHRRHQRRGGLLGRQVELYLEDSATTDSAAEAAAAKLVQQDHVDVIFGGIYSSTRQAIKGPAVVRGQDAVHLPRAVRGAGVRSADLLHRPGAGAAGRAAHPLADAEDRGEEVLPAVGRLHLAARAEREGPRGRHGQRRRDRRRGVLPARSHGLRRDRRRDHVQRRGGRVQHDRAARAHAVPRAAARRPASPSAAGRSSARTSTRTSSTWCRPSTSRGCTAASTTTRTSAIRSARSCCAGTTSCYPRQREVHGRQRVLGHVPRPEAVGGGRQRGRLARPGRRHRGAGPRQIAEGPGGPAEMVPGQHHVRMNMYIAQADERHVQGRQEPRGHRPEGAGPHAVARGRSVPGRVQPSSASTDSPNRRT